MKSLAVLLVVTLCIGSSLCSLGEVNQIETLWNAWKANYQKEYATAEEEDYRLGVFANNYLLIQKWNSEPHTSSMEVNQFADLTTEEFASMYVGGWISDIEKSKGAVKGKPVPPLPNSWDWRSYGAVTGVMEQGPCACDYAMAAAATLETCWFTSHASLRGMSVQQIVDCDQFDAGCKGGAADMALEYASSDGMEFSGDYPYSGEAASCKYAKNASHKVNQGSVYTLPNNETDFKYGILFNPVAAIVEADQPVWQFYSGGVITANCTNNTNHWITTVGWGNSSDGTPMYIVKNSWGTSWGDHGYVYIGTDNTTNEGSGVCGILTEGVFPLPNI